MGPIISPGLTGIIVQRTDSYFLAFVAAAAVLLAGTLVYLVLVPQVAPIRWGPAPEKQ
jgi:hypothetical protein